MATTVNMFWHGGALPSYAWFCMQSFLDRGHAVRLFAYDTLTAPQGVTPADAGNILNADELSRYRSVASFSDVFRYELLFKEGGWWADVDVVCLADKLPEASYAWAEQEPGLVNVAILKFPKADPLLAQLAAKARGLASGTAWGATGPHLLSELLRACHPIDRAGSTSEFYPIHWLEAPLLLLPEYKTGIVRRLEKATFLHLWAHVFEDIGIGLDRSPRGSLMYDFAKTDPEHSATLWRQLKTRQAIRKYWRQSWVTDQWAKVFGAEGRIRPAIHYRHLLTSAGAR
jgi:hypothetical protein